MTTSRETPPDPSDAQRLYLDFDSFFASAEQHFNPALRCRPVGVVPLDARGTGCIAMSREAKTLGVPSGATVIAARDIAPEMIFVVARPDAYVRLHHRILAVIEACVPIAKVRSIDELVCHLLPSEAAQAAELAAQIKASLAREFSEVLTCSIGIAPTEMLAKVGAEMNKPDGLVILRSSELPDRIANLPLRDLPGISEGIERRCHAAGIRSIPDLWATQRKQARAIWGNVEGERFWSELHGHHTEREPTVKRMFGHSRNLPRDWRNPESIRACARQLVLSAARRLRRTDKSASKLTLSMRGGDYGSSRNDSGKKLRWSREVPFAATRSDHAFLTSLYAGLDQSERELSFVPRAVSVMLHGLLDEAEIQPDLFAAGFDFGPKGADISAGAGTGAGKVVGKDQKHERLSDVLDSLRQKHGPSAASYGPKVDLPGGYLGAKIAFGRIPDLQDFSEAQTEDAATHFYSQI